RELHQSLKTLPEAAPIIRKRLGSGRVALLFGSEKRGLSNADLSHCHWLLRIPTREGHASMNLGQAVAVCLYQPSRRRADGTSTEHRFCTGRAQPPSRPRSRTRTNHLIAAGGFAGERLSGETGEGEGRKDPAPGPQAASFGCGRGSLARHAAPDRLEAGLELMLNKKFLPAFRLPGRGAAQTRRPAPVSWA